MPINRITPALPINGNAQTVFVTGAAGFIGSHVVDLLLKKGYQVVAIDDLSTGSLQNLESAQYFPNFEFFSLDAAQFEWQKQLKKQDIIIHLAAAVGVKKVCESALQTAHNNHRPIEIILESMRQIGGGRFIYASTSEVYGDSPPTGSSEQDLLQVHTHLGGRSAYTVSKLYGELIAQSYAASFGLPVTILRLFNTIGPRQRYEYGMVAPIFVRQALSGIPITLFGDGAQTRSFCNVFDIAEAIVKISETCHTAGKIYNLGNPSEISMLELAEFIKTETKSQSPIAFLPFPPERAGKTDIRNRKPNIARISTELGWAPQIDWRDTIRQIIYEQELSYAQCLHH